MTVAPTTGVEVVPTSEGIVYRPLRPDPAQDWFADPGVAPGQADILAFISQLEELGYAEPRSSGDVLVSWGSFYAVRREDDISPTSRELPVPEIDATIVPVLTSRGTLTSADFDISISEWRRTDGTHVANRLSLTGPVLADGPGGRSVTLDEPVYDLVAAINAFSRRLPEDRDARSNKLGWARIREDALRAGAGLATFLRETIVLQPRMLDLEFQRVQAGDDIAVHVTPTFDAAPHGWERAFDRSRSTADYKVSSPDGYYEILVEPDVGQVLSEIKSWPARSLSGARARQLIENPIAYFGPELAHVFDEQAIERGLSGLRDQAWAWTPAIDVQDGRVVSAGITVELIGETSEGRTDVRLFSTVEGLQAFIDGADRAIREQESFFAWSSLELEVGPSSAKHVDDLRGALTAWQSGADVTVEKGARKSSRSDSEVGAGFVIDAALVLDVSRYYDRVDAIGVETPYGIISIPLGRKGAWLPEDQELRLLLSGGPDGEPIEIALDRQQLDAFIQSVGEAEKQGSATVPLPSGGDLTIERARDFVSSLPRALIDDVKAESEAESPAVPSPPRARTGLLLKSNIEDEDYVTRRKLGLRPPDGAAALLPRSLREGVTLKEHQRQGLLWLQHLFTLAPDQCRGALLADDMGLGKTLQALSLVARAREDDPDLAPALVVAPVTLLENWEQEIERFFEPGSVTPLTLYGAGLKEFRVRKSDIDSRLQEQNLRRFLRPGWADDAALVLTTYETLRDYEFSFGEVSWSIVICDEAQRIKNPNALVSRAAKKLDARFCVAATGTPVENNLTDLWSLFDFIQPGLLDPLNRFNRKYRRPIESKTHEERERLEELRGLLEPQWLRRTKADVAKDLPSKTRDEGCLSLRMSPRQVALYRSALDAQRVAASTATTGTQILQLISVLRRICTDPRAAHELDQPLPGLSEYREVSPKLDWLLTTLDQVRAREEKAIVFLDRKDIQRLVQAYMREHFGFAPEIINGDTPTGAAAHDSRQRRIDRFQSKRGFNVLILSPVAAGVGLNIQEANHVVHYMRHWNPAKEDQATDRAYRIGQTKDVIVYTPTVVGDGWVSFDERLDELLEKKRSIASDVLNGADNVDAAEFADLLS